MHGLLLLSLLRFIKMIISPLVFATLTVIIGHAGNEVTVGHLGGKALAWLVFASLLSLSRRRLLVGSLEPGKAGQPELPTAAASGMAQSSADAVTRQARRPVGKREKESTGANVMSEVVLVTGISGFIAKHVALALLGAGYRVRGTVRDRSAGKAVADTLARHGADVAMLDFVVTDLTRDTGWDEAIAGCDYVQHLASPFPIEAPADRESLVPVAREGTLRVLRRAFASGVRRVVETSSIVAMMYRAGRPARFSVTEQDWTDPEWAPLSAYIVSKTRAERAAWEAADAAGDRERLCTVHPGFVLGPLLDAKSGTSVDVIRLFLTGAYPAVPKVAYPVVDVRDLAAVHVAAMRAEGAGGRRLIAAGETLSMRDMALALREAFPERARKIPIGQLPDTVVRLAGYVDRQLRSLRGDLGVTPGVDASYVTAMTCVAFRPSREAVVAAGRSLFEHGVVA